LFCREWAGQGTSYPPDFSQGDSWTMVYPAEGSLEAIGEGLLRLRQDWNLAEP
jgi:hypothetical protein